MIKMLAAINAGMKWMKDFPNATRFDLANMLHGYDHTLGFNQLTEITREIGCRLNKGIW